MRSMSLSDEERILIIEYRKHDSGTKRSVRILLDMDEPKHTQAEVIPYKIRQATTSRESREGSEEGQAPDDKQSIKRKAENENE